MQLMEELMILAMEKPVPLMPVNDSWISASILTSEPSSLGTLRATSSIGKLNSSSASSCGHEKVVQFLLFFVLFLFLFIFSVSCFYFRFRFFFFNLFCPVFIICSILLIHFHYSSSLYILSFNRSIFIILPIYPSSPFQCLFSFLLFLLLLWFFLIFTYLTH